MVKKGDRVTIDGKTAKVTGWYGAGKHRVFTLDDGRTVFDLHLLLEEGDATVSDDRSDALDELAEVGQELDLEDLAEKHPAPDEFWDEEDAEEDEA